MAQRVMSKAGGRFFDSNHAFMLSVWCFFSFLVGAAVAGEAIAASSTAPKDATGATDLKVLQERLGHPQPITWVFTGDSITHGAFHTQAGFRSYPELFAERVRWEMRRFRDVVINTGISGHTTEHLSADWEWRVERFKPDVVSIMMGMNDATGGSAGREKFRGNLRDMVKKARTAHAIPILNTPNPISLTSPDPRRTDLPAYAHIILEVAKELDCVCVDHYNHWLKTRPQASELAKWLNDPIHPGVTGHREMVREIFRSLGIFDEKSLTCQLE